jgi:hypothetical protein
MNMRDAGWQTWTSTLGYPVMGLRSHRRQSHFHFMPPCSFCMRGESRMECTGAREVTAPPAADRPGMWREGMDGTDINACDRAACAGPGLEHQVSDRLATRTSHRALL